jgi:hypothetical protein
MGRRVHDGSSYRGSQPSKIVRRDFAEGFQAPSDFPVKRVALKCAGNGFVAERDGGDAVQDRLGFVSIDVRHFSSLA